MKNLTRLMIIGVLAAGPCFISPIVSAQPITCGGVHGASVAGLRGIAFGDPPVGSTSGAVIESINPPSPFLPARIPSGGTFTPELGDMITAVNGIPISCVGSLMNAMNSVLASTSVRPVLVSFTIWQARFGASVTISAVIS
ncbi:hypothetical protein [Polyangium jinanense]|uniref:PDZ domain-containing protein n=1 Tax=Polyangium jinanense TaxID=2829994 RepID=A0A9X3XDY9_9BACT|nr:hypothetical protein [Polyangium jinanense]MDC3987670.1 hypothetical protein [Polyangium jinanense]